MSLSKVKIKKDDIVKVIAGKEKNKKGKVIVVYPSNGKVLVEKLNLIKRHTKPNNQNKQGGIIEKEGSIHISNLMVVCDKCDKPVRLAIKKLENGDKVRICKKCSEIVGVG